MTDNLPAKDERLEVKLPVIVCPFCGEKDPHKLALHTVDREHSLDIEHMQYGPGDPIVPYPTHENSNIRIEGNCVSCQTQFDISISARTPYRNALADD
jgi:hypothetical protein